MLRQDDSQMRYTQQLVFQPCIAVVFLCALATTGCGGVTVEQVTPAIGEIDHEYVARMARVLSGSHQEFARLCVEHNNNACYVLGARFESSSHRLPMVVDAATRFYRLGCDRKHPESCLSLAQLYESTGQVLLATTVLNRQCATGQMLSCSLLARMTKSEEAARVLHQRACRAGVAKSCLVIADHARKHGEVDKAEAAYRSACTSGLLSACARYASMQVRSCFERESTGAKKNECSQVYRSTPDEWRRWRDGCRHGHHAACALSTRLEFSSGQFAAAADRLSDSCRKGEPIACQTLAGMLRTGRHLQKDLRRSVRLYSLACHYDSAHACFYAAMGQWALDGDVKKTQSIEVIRKMCVEKSHRPSCRWLASNCIHPTDCP